jgi:hypothetical protein
VYLSGTGDSLNSALHLVRNLRKVCGTVVLGQQESRDRLPVKELSFRKCASEINPFFWGYTVVVVQRSITKHNCELTLAVLIRDSTLTYVELVSSGYCSRTRGVG